MAFEQYEGGCQCGAVRYEVGVDLENTITCNCSRCQRMGFVLVGFGTLIVRRATSGVYV